MWWIFSGVIAAFLTYLELDQAFYIPERTQKKAWLYTLVSGFVVLNAVLAVGLYALLVDNPGLQLLPIPFRAVLIGATYLALIRVKFATLKVEKQEVPLGLDFFYDKIRKSLYKHINSILLKVQYEEAVECAKKHDLQELATRARFNIDNDSSLNSEEMNSAKDWLLKILEDTQTSDLDKRMVLASFVLSGRRNSTNN